MGWPVDEVTQIVLQSAVMFAEIDILEFEHEEPSA